MRFEIGIIGNMGVFFSLMALGLIGSRTFCGTLIDKGKTTQVIFSGTILSLILFPCSRVWALFPA
jgi:hypothetical protein